MFERDKAVKNFIDIIEKGDLTYQLTTTESAQTADCSFRIDDNRNFILTFTLEEGDSKSVIDLDYFFERPFALNATGVLFFIYNYHVISGKKGISSNKFQIEIKGFRGDNDDFLWMNSKQGAYIKFDERKFKPWGSGIQFDLTTGSKDKGSYNAIALNIDGIDLIFYYEMLSTEDSYFVITPKKNIDFEKFKAIVDALITAHGFVTGYYMKDSIYYFTTKEVDGKAKISYIYENNQKLIHTNSPIVDGGNYKDIKDSEIYLSSKHFNNLVNLLYKDTEYLRSAQLLIEAGLLNDCPKAALGAVSLETIAKKIDIEIRKFVVDDKSVIRKLRNDLKRILKTYSSLNEEQLQIFENRINKINDNPNAKKLLGAFSYLHITLDEEEIECINSRNSFLHGSLPKNNSESWLRDDELLSIMANRLIMLSSILLLKLSGYEGYVIDKGMTEVIKWRMIMNGQKVSGGNCLRMIRSKDD